LDTAKDAMGHMMDSWSFVMDEIEGTMVVTDST
jgi:hypothetical protein